MATLKLNTGAAARLACSWRLHAGRDAIISAAFYGTEGGAELSNVGGSFYDFVAEHHRGTARKILCAPPDAWFGRAAVDWAARLAAGERFAPTAERLVDIARVLDRIYGRDSIQHDVRELRVRGTRANKDRLRRRAPRVR